jgi:DNA-binding transcriptional LysR family regulator
MGDLDLTRINANLIVSLDLLLREQSLTRAAEHLGVTPSAMSHTLRQLRELFGDPLLIRTSHGLRPSPRAERLSEPLRRALRTLERALVSDARFEPASAERHFVVAAPDFLSTLIVPPLLSLLSREAPRIEVEVRLSQRRASLWQLEEGELDLLLGAVIGELPGLRRGHLYDDHFVCIARKAHPAVGKRLTLETFARLPHALISISDDRSPSWVDERLAELGHRRFVQLRTRYFTSVPLVIAQSDLVATVPYQLARYFAARAPLRLHDPPIPLPQYAEEQLWHERFDQDPAHRWFRAAVQRATREVALIERPLPATAQPRTVAAQWRPPEQNADG